MTATTLPKSMKAWVQPASGSTAQMQFVTDRRVPTPGPGEVLVRIAAAGINPIDWKRSEPPFNAGLAFPSVHGVDGSGQVVAVGEGVSKEICDVGDYVYFHTWLGQPDGSFAEFAIAIAEGVCRLGGNFDLLAAGACPCVLWTAGLALFHKLAIASRVKHVIVTASAAKAEFVKGLAAPLLAASGKLSITKLSVIDYTTTNIQDAVKELTGGCGCDKVFDTITNENAARDMLPITAFNGHLAFLLGVPLTAEQASAIFFNQLSTHAVLWGGCMKNDPKVARAIIGKCHAMVTATAESPAVKIPITKKWAFETEVKAALEENKKGRTLGKTVVVVDEKMMQ